MEQEKLPNATISLVLGIISYIACCFLPFAGLVTSGIALYLANKDRKVYLENPELYENYNQVKTARVVAIIALILTIIASILTLIGLIIFGSIAGIQEWAQEMQTSSY